IFVWSHGMPCPGRVRPQPCPSGPGRGSACTTVSPLTAREAGGGQVVEARQDLGERGGSVTRHPPRLPGPTPCLCRNRALARDTLQRWWHGARHAGAAGPVVRETPERRSGAAGAQGADHRPAAPVALDGLLVVADERLGGRP